MSSLLVNCDGELLANCDGDKLVVTCPGPEVTCNECDPPLANSYTVTASGFTTTDPVWLPFCGIRNLDPSGYNGTWTLLWNNTCDWIAAGNDSPLVDVNGLILLSYREGVWHLSFYLCVDFLDIGFTGGTDPCDPTGTYSKDLAWAGVSYIPDTVTIS